MNNFIHICPKCFADKQTAKQCPSCGYDETLAQQNPLYLKPRTLLNQRYLIGNVIGHGGFGITYVSWDIKLERKVAIKEFLPTMLATRTQEMSGGETKHTVMAISDQEEAFKTGLKKFLKEAKILAGFAHENIVRVIDYFENHETGYIVMEYVGQEDLSQLLKRQPGKRFSVEEALNIFLPILSALKVIHANGIYHQDISLQNIRIAEDQKPVLIDFGAARYIVGELSRSLDRIFKPGYSPLEQITNDSKKIGPWTDLYACGAVFYTMIMGELPPPSLERLEQDDLIAPEKKLEILPSVNNAILKALSVRIGDRFQTADEFEKALLIEEKIPVTSKKPWLAAIVSIFFTVAIVVIIVNHFNFKPKNVVPPSNEEIPTLVEEKKINQTEMLTQVPLVPQNEPLLNIYLWKNKVTFEVPVELSETHLSEDDRTQLKDLAERIFEEMGYKIVNHFFSTNFQKIGSFLCLTKTNKKDNVVYSHPITGLFLCQSTDKNPVELHFVISPDYSRGARAFIHNFNMALNTKIK